MSYNQPQPSHYSSLPKLIEGRQWISSALSLISIDEGTQLDLLGNSQKVDKYYEVMSKKNWDWQKNYHYPIVLLFDKAEGKLWCADGHCRIKAARLIQNSDRPELIYAQIRPGNFREAKYFYCLANLRHGAHSKENRRTLIFQLITNIHSFPLADRRRVWSDREIARQIGNVDHKTIGRIRHQVVETMTPGERFYRQTKLNEQQRVYRVNLRRLTKFLSEVQDIEVAKMLHNVKPDFRDKLINGVVDYTEKFKY